VTIFVLYVRTVWLGAQGVLIKSMRLEKTKSNFLDWYKNRNKENWIEFSLKKKNWIEFVPLLGFDRF